MKYGIDDSPPVHIAILYGFQVGYIIYTVLTNIASSRDHHIEKVDI